ncbi:g7583 [Coccomyxa viridis]|uniref:G7583 protein n=1 Tax=Coccomyxa viridis TaxID=1274662 RepID=A0ABP1FZC5_9CHLO
MLPHFGKGLHRSLIRSLVPGEAWGLRLIQKLAEDYSESFVPLPPVSFDEETGPPSVLQWLRRRGPPVSEACRNRLVREKRVRLLEDGRLRQIGPSAALQEGAQLLLPRTAVAEWQAPRSPPVKDLRTEMLEDALMQHLRANILHKDRDMLIINKPAGLPVQGGDAIRVSLDSLLPQLAFGSSERPRLVHRLDRGTSGALILARSRDAATRLSRAFRQASASLADACAAAEPDEAKEIAGPMVQKMYLAIVEEGDRLERSGYVGPTVRQMQGAPAASGRKPKQKQRSAPEAEDDEMVLTKYTTLARCQEKFALLALQPVTGRKHQLRKACANVLRAPIVGDGRYALLRSPEQRWFQERLQALPAVPEDRPEEALGSMLRCNRHLQLHCFQLRVRDAEGFLVEATAPLPAHMRNAIRMLFRSLPEDLDAALAKMVQLTDFSSPQFLQQALAAAQYSAQSRQRAEPAKASRSPVLPRSSHVELPANPKFQHLSSLSTARESESEASRSGDESEGNESDSDGESRPRKARWTNAEKREAKEKRRAVKKAKREREKEYRKRLETPLQWEK